jgi:hypothetical protein
MTTGLHWDRDRAAAGHAMAREIFTAFALSSTEGDSDLVLGAIDRAGLGVSSGEFELGDLLHELARLGVWSLQLATAFKARTEHRIETADFLAAASALPEMVEVFVGGSAQGEADQGHW